MKTLSLIILSLVLLSGCVPYQRKADSGGASWSRTEEVKPDGSKTVKEEATFSAPQDDRKGSSFALKGPGSPYGVSGSFGGQYAPPEPDSVGSVWGQYALYGSGIVCILLAGVLIGYGRHFKLGGISAGVGALLIGGAVVIDRFPALIVLGVGGVIILGGAFLGWQLWVDYKEKKAMGITN